MSDRPVIRLFRFRPARVEFDRVLRTIMVPDVRRIDGLIDVHVGRHGPEQPEQLGDRVVATIWTDRTAMNAGMGPSLAESTFHPDRLSDTTDQQLEAHELDLLLRFPEAPASTLLRLFRGQVKPGELAAYIDEARVGTLADVKAERGPAALYLAADPPDRFLTLSLWPDWAAIERATGGDVRRPMATKDSARIVDMDIVHYEVVTDAT